MDSSSGRTRVGCPWEQPAWGSAGSWLEGISKTVKPAKGLACFTYLFIYFWVSMYQHCKPWGYGACPQALTSP